MSLLVEPYSMTQSYTSRRSSSLSRRRPDVHQRRITDIEGSRLSLLFPYDMQPSTLRSRTPGGARKREVSPVSSSVDPELKDAQKYGNRYHITMNFNPTLDSPASPSTLNLTSATHLLDQLMRSNSSSSYRPANFHHPLTLQGTLSPKRRTASDRGPSVSGSVVRIASKTDEVELEKRVAVRGSRLSDVSDLAGGQVVDGYVIRSVRPSTSQLTQTSTSMTTDEASFAIRSVTPSQIAANAFISGNEDEKVSFDLQLIGTESLKIDNLQQHHQQLQQQQQQQQQISHMNVIKSSNKKNQPQMQMQELKESRDSEPRYTMTIQETMTMDYQPDEHSQSSTDDIKQVKSVNNGNSSRPRLAPAKGIKALQQHHRQQTKEDKVIQQSHLSGPYGETIGPKAAPRNVHRKRTKSAKKETVSNDAERSARGEIIIKNTVDRDERKRLRNVMDADEADEGGFIVFEDLSKRDLGSLRPFDQNMIGQGLKGAKGPRQHIDEPDWAGSPVKERASTIAPSMSTSSRIRIQSEDWFPLQGTRSRAAAAGRVGAGAERIEAPSDDGFNTQIEINRGLSAGVPKMSSMTTRNSKMTAQQIPLPSLSSSSLDAVTTSNYVQRLMKDAPDNSIRQRVDVQRQEEEVVGPLSKLKSSKYSKDNSENLLNMDAVSEKVDMTLADGMAQLTVKVICERLVPIQEATDLYKKSSVIVSRIIDVDLTVTEERKLIYDQVMMNRQPSGKLSSKDTFELYMAFMELAHESHLAEDHGWDQEQVWIDENVDEERLAKHRILDAKLDSASAFSRVNRFAAMDRSFPSRLSQTDVHSHISPTSSSAFGHGSSFLTATRYDDNDDKMTTLSNDIRSMAKEGGRGFFPGRQMDRGNLKADRVTEYISRADAKSRIIASDKQMSMTGAAEIDDDAFEVQGTSFISTATANGNDDSVSYPQSSLSRPNNMRWIETRNTRSALSPRVAAMTEERIYTSNNRWNSEGGVDEGIIIGRGRGEGRGETQIYQKEGK